MKFVKRAMGRLFIILVMFFCISLFWSEKGQAAEYSAVLAADYSTGVCVYMVQGLDISQTDVIKLQVSSMDTGLVIYEQDIALTGENCIDGIYQGEFTLADLNNVRASYLVNIVVQDEKVLAGSCDFSVYVDKVTMKVKGSRGAAVRTAKLDIAELSGSPALAEDSKIVILAWPDGAKETAAVAIGETKAATGSSITCSVDVTEAGVAYGTWHAKAVLKSDQWSEDVTLAETEYEVAPEWTDITAKKSKALEAKSSFAIDFKGLKNAYGIKKVTFDIYNSKGKKAASIAGKKKTENDGRYYTEVSLKKLGYVLDVYTIKVALTDSYGNEQMLDVKTSVDECAHDGTLSVTKKGKGTCSYRLTEVYIPGNIKKVEFVAYQIKDHKEKKLGTYTAKSNAKKTKFWISVKKEEPGDYKVMAYGITAWGKKLFLNQQTYGLENKDMGKNGWYYEKYNGRKYKFYYINDKKQTDLTNLLKLQKSNAGTGSNLYIELNREACTVTIYLYNEETGKYDIPVKSCAVSVGRDTYTTAGSGSLNTSSSYTPLGDYSICTNGTSVKYTLKPMYEPDGSTVYARWCTHIVGNVYFHAIAVGSDTHYGLSSYTYNKLGSAASAGCVRMTVADAKWIYDYAKTGTKVTIVKGDSSKPGPLGKPKAIRTTSSIYYDPTDPEVPDSRKKADYKAGKISGYITKDGKRVDC